MPGFVAKEQVDELTYNFEPWGPQGEIPEPSAAQITAFRKGVAEMFEATLPEGMDEGEEKQAELVKKVIEFIGRDTSEVQEKILHSVADVCSDRPSYDVLEALPYRHQQAFVGWVTGVFLLPQTLTPVTSR